ADMGGGTGLGSSGSFTTALLKALHTLTNRLVGPRELAEQACHIEIDLLGEPVGKQDQYIAATGGVTCFEFHPDEGVEAWPLKVSTETLYNLEDSLLLFFTGYTRAASTILREQDIRTRGGEEGMLQDLHYAKELGHRSKDALEAGDLRGFAELLRLHWERKRRRGTGITNSEIDRWYEVAMASGALGGKLIGAGGGGF